MSWPDVASPLPLQGHSGNVTAVLFSPDGRQLVSACGGGAEIRVWQAATGTCGAVLQVGWGGLRSGQAKLRRRQAKRKRFAK